MNPCARGGTSKITLPDAFAKKKANRCAAPDIPISIR
ncbi:hypothetical protein, partial [Faecalibaculum rodentium]